MPRVAARRRRRVSGLLVAVVIAVTLSSGGHPSVADQLSDAQQQRNDVGNLANLLRGQLAAAKDQEAQLQRIINGLDQQIAQTQQVINDGQVKLAQIEAALAEAQNHLIAINALLEADKKKLAQEVVLVYQSSTEATPVNDLLASGDFNNVWRHLIDLRRISDMQHETVNVVHQEQHDIEVTLAQISDAKQKQQSLLVELHQQAQQLAQQMNSQEAARQVLAQVVAQDQKRLAEAEQAARELDSEIAALKAAQEAALRRGGGNGHFIWPESGPITQGFGCSPYPFEPYAPWCASRHYHSGLDIAAGWGTPIVAADSGIAYSYYSAYGYGAHVIMVHGNGWSTVYGHLSSFAAANGQAVARGQVIGYEGSTGNSTGPHLHFEVRLNGVPLNPLAYLP